ncbi:MAG TPA: phosphotransferase [Candidatus Polarisedimenticolia bacterium]|nr:phosphotransferase [Candidatus Polarisedimenticolia bacterium]
MQISKIGEHFDIRGAFRGAAPYGSGHINETFLAEYDEGGRTVRYLHQRLNRRVFPDPVSVMENIRRVLEHLRRKLAQLGVARRERRVLELIPCRDGAGFWRDEEGEVWRTYQFIEGTRCVDVPESPGQVEQAALAFGGFQKLLLDLPGSRLHETIPHFHDTPRRMQALGEAVAADAAGRVVPAKSEIEFALSRVDLAGALARLRAAGDLAERVVHNDTKLNNVLLDGSTGEALCVIDLDTVMPGLGPWDFGDLVRSAANPSAEDERDLSRAKVDPQLFSAITKGWIESLGSVLAPSERGALVTGAKVITLECGARFLTDHLQGDAYFKIRRPGQNLDRARVQLSLLRSLEEREDELERMVERCGVRP